MLYEDTMQLLFVPLAKYRLLAFIIYFNTNSAEIVPLFEMFLLITIHLPKGTVTSIEGQRSSILDDDDVK